jgi:hypothetical protein
MTDPKLVCENRLKYIAYHFYCELYLLVVGLPDNKELKNLSKMYQAWQMYHGKFFS